MAADPQLTLLLAGLGASVAFGSGDFSGGVATKRVPAVVVVTLSHLFSLAVFVAAAALCREAVPGGADLAWSGAAGLGGAVGTVALYRGLALGPMGVVAAVSAALAAGLPVLAALGAGHLPGPWQGLGLGLAIGGVAVLASAAPAAPAPAPVPTPAPSPVPAARAAPGVERVGGPGGLACAVLAGLGIGAFFVGFGQTTPGAIFWPLACARACSATWLLAATLRRGRGRGSAARGRPGGLAGAAGWLLLSAALDAAGNLLFVVAVQTGLLAQASVLANLYPAVTTLLATAVLGERLRPGQWLGLGVTLAGVLLITRHG